MHCTAIYMKTQCLQTNETQHCFRKGKCFRSDRRRRKFNLAKWKNALKAQGCQVQLKSLSWSDVEKEKNHFSFIQLRLTNNWLWQEKRRKHNHGKIIFAVVVDVAVVTADFVLGWLNGKSLVAVLIVVIVADVVRVRMYLYDWRNGERWERAVAVLMMLCLCCCFVVGPFDTIRKAIYHKH